MDRLFVHLDTSSRDSINVALGIGEMLVGIVNRMDQPLVDELATADVTDYTVSLINVEDIGLPESLYGALKAGEPLILESDLNLSLYFRLDDGKQVLMIRLPADSGVNTRLGLFLTLAFYALVAALLLVWLYPLVRRLRLLATVAKRFGEGDLQQRVVTSPESSLYDIESEFNRMAQRLQALVEDNKLLSGAVSHDLRTPLARLRFGIDALEEQIDMRSADVSASASVVSPRIHEYLGRINTDLAEMEQLVEVLLEFARLDQQLSELPLTSVDLVNVVNDCVDSFTLDNQCSFQSEIAVQSARILADQRYISMLVSNLIHNAAKFSVECVRVSLLNTASVHADVHEKFSADQQTDAPQVDSNRFVLIIEDDGPGIDPSSVSRITKPFEKGALKPVKQSAKSYGLGLAIVTRIAQWFGATLEFGVSEALGGAKVCIAFESRE